MEVSGYSEIIILIVKLDLHYKDKSGYLFVHHFKPLRMVIILKPICQMTYIQMARSKVIALLKETAIEAVLSVDLSMF